MKTAKKLPREEKYLLYIDMLGFSDMVERTGKIQKLYRIIDSLNAHSHDAFQTIVFSDTILVYNKTPARDQRERNYLIMYLCEFAQDLFFRLIPLDLHFRAYLRFGQFVHQKMQNVEAFFGKALVDSYKAESDIQCCGLFIDKSLIEDCDIFYTSEYDKRCNFVHIMQALENISGEIDFSYPLEPILIAHTDVPYYLAECFLYLKQIHRHMHNSNLSPRIRSKYAATWLAIRSRHKRLLDHLELNEFDPASVCKINWAPMMNKARKP